MNILISAGPTREAIDPVRFITNLSTGTMGYALAEAAIKRGHRVTLISGPADLTPPKGAKFVAVQTARQMQRALNKHFKSANALIMTAAVADYRPAKVSRGKIKKERSSLNLKLVKNPDILSGLGRKKGKRILVGFALQTEDMAKNAKKKLAAKNLDLIAANKFSPGHSSFGKLPSLRSGLRRTSPFGKGRTSITLFDRNGKVTKLPAVNKNRIAIEILKRAEQKSLASARKH